MSGTRAVTVRLDAADYARLESEAKRLGMQPGTLARVLVKSRLADQSNSEDEERRRRGLEALEMARALTADLPPVDALRFLHEARDELAERPYF